MRIIILLLLIKSAGAIFPTGDIVALGDIHGCAQCLQDTLKENGIVNDYGDWIAGNKTVVQLGDIIGRGSDYPQVIHNIQRLMFQAEKVGGKWVQLLGNHEYMELNSDFRYANDGPSSGFGSTERRRAAFQPGGSEGDWLRSLPVIHKQDGIVFVHGGLSDLNIAKLCVDLLTSNPEYRDLYRNLNRDLYRNLNRDLYRDLILNHILWDRTLSLGNERDICPRLDKVLEIMSSQKLVVGHTITEQAGFEPGEIGQRCNGKLILVDVGMSDAFPNIPKYNRALHIYN